MRTIMTLGLVAMMALLLNGCATGSGKGGVATDGTGSGSASSTDVGSDSSATGMDGTSGFAGHPLDDPQSVLASRTVLFDFDSYQVDSDGRAILAAHAEYLVGNPAAMVVLEGHCDERGTREYNMALGERRARAVGDILMALGVSAGQISTSSQGEEQPVALCHDDSCWRLNRRAEVVYTAR
ncbi:MAG: peptidoglycan-associated lipoprotein Pal [Gammaproteobacteria bacterium]|nr:peptidoglycan-associated lipoprotein Pal [Gammaproteobacteria bacterium]